MNQRQFYVYIMTNRYDTVMYTGITNDLAKRVWQHHFGAEHGFTKRYRLTKLVYFEVFEDAYSAISREKQIKSGSRRKKAELVSGVNPGWRDLSAEVG